MDGQGLEGKHPILTYCVTLRERYARAARFMHRVVVILRQSRGYPAPNFFYPSAISIFYNEL